MVQVPSVSGHEVTVDSLESPPETQLITGVIENVTLNGSFGDVRLDEPIEEQEYAIISIETKGRIALKEALGGDFVEGTRVQGMASYTEHGLRLHNIELVENEDE